MRPRVPLVERVAKATGVPTSIVQDTIRNPPAGDQSCWEWGLSCKGTTPMIMVDGRPQPVRRVLVTTAYGELPATTRVMPACPNKRCVNPAHTRVKHQFTDGHVQLAALADFESDKTTVDDVVDAIYSCEQPWDAVALAAEFDYPVALVEQAIRKIVDEGL